MTQRCRLHLESLEKRIVPSMVVTPAALPAWDVGQAGYRQAIHAYPIGGPITFAVSSGALPSGFFLDSSSGLVSGTPAAAGTFDFTISATGARGATASRAYALVVNPLPALGTTTAPAGDVGVGYRLPLDLHGGTAPYTFTVAAHLPPGLTLHAATKMIRGVPTAAGSYAFTVKVVDAAGATVTQPYTIAIDPPLVIRTTHLLPGELGTTYSRSITASGGTGPIAFQALAAPPPGLTFDSAGVLSGTPTVHGTFALAVAVTDQAGARVRRDFGVAIATVFAVPLAAKAGYLQSVTQATFGTQIIRVAGNPGAAITTASGTTIGVWSRDARHNYNLNEAWNADSSLLVMENRTDDGGTPNQLYLNGSTYQVEFGTPSNMPGAGSYDQRWNPNPAYSDDAILAGDGTDQFWWFNVVTNTIDRTFTLPMPVAYIGNTKGNVSQDGQFVCLGDLTHFFVVDMNAYPTERIGPIFDLSSLGIDCTVNSYCISPSGKFVVVHYSELDGQAGDFEQVLAVDPNTLALSPQPMSVSWPGMVGNPALGFVYQLGHEDMALDPFLGNADVMIGQEHCGNIGANIPGIATVNSDGIGHVVMVQLANGAVTFADRSGQRHDDRAGSVRRPCLLPQRATAGVVLCVLLQRAGRPLQRRDCRGADGRLGHGQATRGHAHAFRYQRHAAVAQRSRFRLPLGGASRAVARRHARAVCQQLALQGCRRRLDRGLHHPGSAAPACPPVSGHQT